MHILKIFIIKTMDIFLVECDIEDGMKGEHVILGIFNNENLAHEYVTKLLKEKNCDIHSADGWYSATYTNSERSYYHFGISITKYIANETTIPFFMKS